MLIPAFANGAYTSQSLNVDSEACINWYPEAIESPGAKAPVALYPCPGFETLVNLAPGPVRGLYQINGRQFAVSGYVLYELDSVGATTVRGSVAFDANPATFASNGDAGNQLFITAGDVGYCFDLGTNTLTTEIASGATMCAYLDGYFLVLDTATSTLKVSGLLDGTTWDPTQIAQRLQGADHLVGLVVLHSDIWLVGSQTSEVWYDAGTFPFPFEPRPGAFIQQGCDASFALASLGPSLVWLGRNEQGAGVVFQSDGYTPTRISTHAIEFAIQGYTTVDDAVAWVYQDQGHSFYVLNFETENVTWVFDATSRLWHQRGQWDSDQSMFMCLDVHTHCQVGTQHWVGNSLTGQVYVMTITAPTDLNGTGMRRVRRFRAFADNERYVFYSNFQVDMETGVGSATGQGIDPQIMLSWSNDAGHTFCSPVALGVGAQGQYAYRAMLRGSLGRSRNRVFELVCTDPVPYRLTQALVDAEQGTW